MHSSLLVSCVFSLFFVLWTLAKEGNLSRTYVKLLSHAACRARRFLVQKTKSKNAAAVLGKREVTVHDKWARVVMTIAAESVFKLAHPGGLD